MADNIPITPGTGASVSTEEITSLDGAAVPAQHVQRVVLAKKTADGAAIDLPGDSANGIDVDVTRIQEVVSVDGSGATQPISATSLPLPAGAATSANQQTDALTNTQLRSSPVSVSTGITQPTTPTDTQPVSVASLPLPSGASTAAKQDTGNASLASLDGKTVAINTGAVVVSSSALPSGAATSANQSTANTSLNTIATNTGNGATSANQTNGTQQSKITNGTQVADTFAGDTGFNGLVSGNAIKTVSFTTSTAQAVGLFDAANYPYVAVQFTSMGGSSVTTFQTSNDNVTFLNQALQLSSSTNGSSSTVNSSVASALYYGSSGGRYFRLNVTGIISGNTAGVIIFSSSARALNNFLVSAIQSGTWTVGANSATGSTVPANAFYQAINSGGNLSGVSTPGTAANTTGATIVASSMMAQFDDASVGAVTEDNFRTVRMSSRRELYGQIRDAAGNERGANVTAGNALLVDNSAVTQPVSFSNQSVNLNQIAGNTVSTGVGAVGTGVQRVVEANGAGRTLASAGGSASSSGNNTLVAAGTNKLKVYAFSLSTTSTTAVTCIFQSGAGGTELWRVVLQAPTGVSTGANLVVPVPSYLFFTASATLLNLNLSGAQTVHWSCSYFDEA